MRPACKRLSWWYASNVAAMTLQKMTEHAVSSDIGTEPVHTDAQQFPKALTTPDIFTAL